MGMKKGLVLLVCWLLFGVSQAQYVTIPDTNFVNYLTIYYPQCMSGNQLDTTCAAVINQDIVNCKFYHINDLTGIQYFDNLHVLVCGSNQLTSLPPLPLLLRDLDCSSNNLYSLPGLPESLMNLECRANPNLSCLPPLKNVWSLYFYDTGITCLPQWSNLIYTGPPLSSMPLCGLADNAGCSINWNISGRVYQDRDSNCIVGAGDRIQIGVKVNLLVNGTLLQQTTTGSEGFYSFKIPSTGTYNVQLDSIYGNIITCPDTGFYRFSISSIDSLFPDINFSLDSNIYNGIPQLNTNKSDVSLSPNPATTQLNITIDQTLVGTQLNIYNTTGVLVQTVLLSTVNHQLSTESLSTGVYIAEVKTREGSFKKRWVKM